MNSEKNTLLTKRALQVQRGSARAAVLGVNDGLVSVLCITLAVAGSGGSGRSVLLAGFAGLIAGAISMAVGEWISVKSQSDLFSGIIKDIRVIGERDQSVLDESYSKKVQSSLGYSETTARASLRELHNENKFVDAYAQQVMGFNPHETGSPWVAASSSFLLFLFGGVLPLAPWLFISSALAVYGSIILTGLGGLIVGGYVGLTSGRSVVRSSTRQLLIIIFAAAITYGIGSLFGTVAA